MKRIFALLLALAMTMALVSCTQKKGQNDSGSQGNNSQTEGQNDAQNGGQEDPDQEDPQDDDPMAIEPLVEIDYAGEDLLAQKDAYDEYIVEGTEGSEFQVKVLFTAKETVKNFKVLSINAAAEEGVKVEGELYTQEELTPEKAFVLGMIFAGDVPNMGISYEDASGTVHYYSINMSGKDGSLLLVAF